MMWSTSSVSCTVAAPAGRIRAPSDSRPRRASVSAAGPCVAAAAAGCSACSLLFDGCLRAGHGHREAGHTYDASVM